MAGPFHPLTRHPQLTAAAGGDSSGLLILILDPRLPSTPQRVSPGTQASAAQRVRESGAGVRGVSDAWVDGWCLTSGVFYESPTGGARQ